MISKNHKISFFSAKRKEDKEKKQKQKKTVKKVENGMKSPTRELRNGDTGKVIFNKFDLVQDPLEKKESQKVKTHKNFGWILELTKSVLLLDLGYKTSMTEYSGIQTKGRDSYY